MTAKPSLDDIQKAAQRYSNAHGIPARRELLLRIAGVALPSDVLPEQRATVIAAMEGKTVAVVTMTKPDGSLDHDAILARWNASGRAK